MQVLHPHVIVRRACAQFIPIIFSDTPSGPDFWDEAPRQAGATRSEKKEKKIEKSYHGFGNILSHTKCVTIALFGLWFRWRALWAICIYMSGPKAPI